MQKMLSVLKSINLWLISSICISLLVAIPIFVIFSSFFGETSSYLALLSETFLFKYIFNTIILLVGVLFLTFVFGVGIAYFVSFYTFPGSQFFTWAVILSFAVPGYIYAYSLTAFFENYGTLFSLLTFFFGEANYNIYIPRIDSLLGSIFSISFSLFVYVYLLTRALFGYQSQNMIDAGRNMGFSSYNIFKKIILPSAKPGIVAGLSLVAMECISDFGTVEFFNVETLTTAIYDSWITFEDLNTANILSFYLLIFILIFFSLERLSRSKSRFNIPSKGFSKIEKTKLVGKKAFFVFIFCFLIFFLSFIFPLLQMIYWLIKFPDSFDLGMFFSLSYNSITVIIITCSVLIFLSFIVNYGIRVTDNKYLKALTNFSISGYAIPGIILSVTILTFSSYADQFLSEYFFILGFKTLIIGTIFGLIVAYFIRFFSLAVNGIRSGYEKLNHSLDDASYLMGYSKIGTFAKVHVPFLKNNLILICMLLSIDLIKELPITLILRPYNFETFATQAYNFASQDMLEYTALPSLFLMLFASFFILISKKHILKGF